LEDGLVRTEENLADPAFREKMVPLLRASSEGLEITPSKILMKPAEIRSWTMTFPVPRRRA